MKKAQFHIRFSEPRDGVFACIPATHNEQAERDGVSSVLLNKSSSDGLYRKRELPGLFCRRIG